MARFAALVTVMLAPIAATGCDREHPPRPVPAHLEIVTDLPSSGVAGGMAGELVVRVSDADARPMSGVLVSFALTIGGGRAAPASDTTRADGTASTIVTVGTAPGPNEVSAIVSGLAQVRSAILTGVAGSARSLSLSPRLLRLTTSQDSLPASAIARDAFGNTVSGELSWVSRNPALVTVTGVQGTSAFARVAGRPGQTYLVASLAGAADSIPVAVHDASSTPCSFVAAPVDLPVGGTLAFEDDALACVRASDAAEYVLAAHYNSAIAAGLVNISVAADGVVAPAGAFPSPAPSAGTQPALLDSFEVRLREREAAEIGPHLPAARAWYRARAAQPLASLSAVTREGDVTSVNVNAFDFCSDPSMRTARVMAITDGTVMLEDTSNPAGGFSESEYRTMAAVMDTLVMPTDTSAFGAPSDIDRNGRIGILFTRAVNELTPRGATGVVLGFFYVRDLVPRQSMFGSCPGSNAGEMFYVMVPDVGATVGDARTKAFVQGNVISTIAHELQHLINASRRMYVNDAPSANEEVWLNEGLSHIAEELVFYRASKLSARQNLGGAQLLEGSDARVNHDQYMRNNFGRLAQYLRATDLNSPLASNDFLATRGAAWAFLRYIADRAAATDGDLWRRLVNSRESGVNNLDAVLAGTGLTTLGALRDWATALVADDNTTGLAPALSQPSWNFVTALPQVGLSFGLAIPAMVDGFSTLMRLRTGGSLYLRFAVPAGQESLVRVTSGGGIPQPGIRLTILRIR